MAGQRIDSIQLNRKVDPSRTPPPPLPHTYTHTAGHIWAPQKGNQKLSLFVRTSEHAQTSLGLAFQLTIETTRMFMCDSDPFRPPFMSPLPKNMTPTLFTHLYFPITIVILRFVGFLRDVITFELTTKGPYIVHGNGV